MGIAKTSLSFQKSPKHLDNCRNGPHPPNPVILGYKSLLDLFSFKAFVVLGDYPPYFSDFLKIVDANKRVYICVHICVHRLKMTKTISLSDEAYDILKRMKTGKESFSDTIKKLAGRGKLSEVLDLYPEITDKEYEKSAKELRKKIDARLKDMGL